MKILWNVLFAFNLIGVILAVMTGDRVEIGISSALALACAAMARIYDIEERLNPQEQIDQQQLNELDLQKHEEKPKGEDDGNHRG